MLPGRLLLTHQKKNAAPEIAGLTYESAMDLSFAECFDVYYYNDGYKLLDIHDDARYLIVPEGKEAPDDLDPEIQILQQPLDTIYMAATSPMALFDAIGSVDPSSCQVLMLPVGISSQQLMLSITAK